MAYSSKGTPNFLAIATCDRVSFPVTIKRREYFPNKFEKEKRPTQTVASAGRKQEGRRTVKLTRSQVAIAKKLGVPLEEYAKFVK